MRRSPREFVLGLALLAALPAAARESDRQQPMNVEADDFEAAMADTSDSKLCGNVRISQGTLDIRAHCATISKVDGEIRRVVFEGEPAALQQENDAGVLMKAKGRKIDYDVTGESVVLTGDVAVDQGADTLRGERITYDLKNGRLNASGEGTGEAGRIRMTIQPRPPKAEDAAKPAEPATPEGNRP